jgi:hypothetical protein
MAVINCSNCGKNPSINRMTKKNPFDITNKEEQKVIFKCDCKTEEYLENIVKAIILWNMSQNEIGKILTPIRQRRATKSEKETE